MYSIRVELKFSAAHNLRGYKGKCEALHGHNWKVEAHCDSRGLDGVGMVMDFSVLKEALQRILAGLDHTYLNELPPFTRTNPTSEHIAKYIFTRLKKDIGKLSRVVVWENDSCCATYSE